MGVAQLWKTLRDAGCVQDFAGATLDVPRDVDGKVVAVDASVWIMEASQQANLQGVIYGTNARIAKVVLERTLNWLRYGVVPILVLDGVPPEAKLGRLQQRHALLTGKPAAGWMPRKRSAETGWLAPCNRVITSLMHSLGLPVVQAPGEAEAMCAALNAAGLVDAVQTKDVDALLFGATTVYRSLHLQVTSQSQCQLSRCELAAWRDALGLATGGTLALRCVSVLVGGDYNVDGASNVGPAQALALVKTLLEGCQDDRHLPAALLAALAQGPDPEVLALKTCTGCKTCGHESGTKTRITRHGRNGCPGCGTEGQAGGGCLPKPEGAACQCAFHRREGERVAQRVLARAVATPDYVRCCSDALDAYTQQQQQAARASRQWSREQLRWQRRPDCAAIALQLSAFAELGWTYPVVRSKLRPLLVEWDVSQGPPPSPAGSTRPGWLHPIGEEGQDPQAGPLAWQPPPTRQGPGLGGVCGVEFSVASIQKAQGGKEGAAWRYVLQLKRVVGSGTAEDEELDNAWLAGEQPVQHERKPRTVGVPSSQAGAAAPEEDEDDDVFCQLPSQGFGLSQSQSSQAGCTAMRTNRGTAQSDQRAVRMSLVQKAWPQLVTEFEECQANKVAAAAAKAEAKEARLAAKASSQPKPAKPARKPRAGVKASQQCDQGASQQLSVRDFFKEVKTPPGATALGSGRAAGHGALAASRLMEEAGLLTQQQPTGWGEQQATTLGALWAVAPGCVGEDEGGGVEGGDRRDDDVGTQPDQERSSQDTWRYAGPRAAAAGVVAVGGATGGGSPAADSKEHGVAAGGRSSLAGFAAALELAVEFDWGCAWQSHVMGEPHTAAATATATSEHHPEACTHTRVGGSAQAAAALPACGLDEGEAAKFVGPAIAGEVWEHDSAPEGASASYLCPSLSAPVPAAPLSALPSAQPADSQPLRPWLGQPPPAHTLDGSQQPPVPYTAHGQQPVPRSGPLPAGPTTTSPAAPPQLASTGTGPAAGVHSQTQAQPGVSSLLMRLARRRMQQEAGGSSHGVLMHGRVTSNLSQGPVSVRQGGGWSGEIVRHSQQQPSGSHQHSTQRQAQLWCAPTEPPAAALPPRQDHVHHPVVVDLCSDSDDDDRERLRQTKPLRPAVAAPAVVIDLCSESSSPCSSPERDGPQPKASPKRPPVCQNEESHIRSPRDRARRQ